MKHNYASLFMQSFGITGVLITVSAFLVATIMMVLPGTIFVDVMLNDFFILSESAYRVSHGRLAGIDFYSNPLGILTFGPQAIIYRITGDLALAALFSGIFYASLIMTLCLYISITRLHIISGSMVVITLSVLMLSPWVLGFGNFQDGAAQTSNAMFYNRFGFIIVTLAALISISPHNEFHKHTDHLDPLVAALMAALAYYSKAPFGLAVIGLVLFWFGFVRFQLAFIWKFLLYVFLLAATIEIIFPGLNVSYILEQVWASNVVGVLHAFLYFKTSLFLGPELLVSGLLPLVMLWRSRMLTVMESVYFLLLMIGTVLLVTLSAQGYLAVTPFAVSCVGLTLCLSKKHFSSRTDAVFVASVIGFASSVLMLLPPAAFSIWRHTRSATSAIPLEGLPKTYASLRVAREVDLDKMRGAFGGDLSPTEAYRSARLNRPYSTLHAMFPSEYLATAIDLSNAAKYCASKSSAAVIDFVDFAPSLLAISPASGYTYLHFGRSFSFENHPPAVKLFDEVDCIFDPKISIEPIAHDAIWKMYGQYFKSNFKVAGETTFWNVLSRETTKN